MAKDSVVIKFVSRQTDKVDNAWLRGSLQAIPYVGSTLDTWIFQFSEKEKQRRIESELKALKKQVEKLEIDSSYINKHQEEYGFLFERGLTLIAQDYRSDMRDNYRTMLGKFLSKKFSNLDNKELYLQYLSEMTPIHLLTLKIFVDSMNEDGKLKVQPTEAKTFVTKLMVEHGIEEPLAETLVNDLVTRGMITHNQASVIGGDVHYYGVTPVGVRMLELVD